jgi:hypothetical protein
LLDLAAAGGHPGALREVGKAAPDGGAAARRRDRADAAARELELRLAAAPPAICKTVTPPEATVGELRAAADAGEAEAQYRLGLLYACGAGVERDLRMGRALLMKAVLQGHAQALAAADSLPGSRRGRR